MANEKVSQMTALTAAEIAPDDLFLVGDVSAHESKKMTADELLLFVEASGSFPDPTLVDSASYASYAATARSASFADRTISSSHAIRSNFADTASYFSSSIVASISASFADKSHLSDSASFASTAMNAYNASNLIYVGTPNGTASFAISCSTAQSSSFSRTASFASSSSFATTASFTVSSSFANSSLSTITASYAQNFNNPVKAWGMVTWSFGGLYSQPQLYLNSNVSSFTYNRTWNYTNWTWFQYDVTFSIDLPSSNYLLQGQAYSPFLNPEKQDVVFSPVFSNRNPSSCSLFLAVDTTTYTVAQFFAGSSGSFPGCDITQLTFQILGT